MELWGQASAEPGLTQHICKDSIPWNLVYISIIMYKMLKYKRKITKVIYKII